MTAVVLIPDSELTDCSDPEDKDGYDSDVDGPGGEGD